MGRRFSKNVRQCIAQYGQRNSILAKMGFEDYADYLASPLWQSIRIRVLDRDKHQCIGCGKPATQVHHHEYTKADLAGKTLSLMSSICNKCHRFIEFDAKHRKLSPAKATKKLKHRRKRYIPGSTWTKPVKKDKTRSRNPLHDAYQAKVKRIKATLTGRKRDEALGSAIRERSAQINSGQDRLAAARPAASLHAERLEHSASWDSTQEVGAREQSPAWASGKPQSNAVRTQCPPIPMGHQPGNTPSNDKSALQRA